MAKKIRIGEVYRVKTKSCYGYIQYVAENIEYGSLIRKIKGKYSDNNVQDIAHNLTDFYTFFPLQSAVNASEKKKITKNGNLIELVLIGEAAILDKNPILLVGGSGYWELMDMQGNRKFIAHDLTEEMKTMSIVEITNYEALIGQIDTNYTACDHVLFKN